MIIGSIPNIAYKYKVNDIEYESKNIGIFKPNATTEEKAELRCRQYCYNKIVDVFYLFLKYYSGFIFGTAPGHVAKKNLTNQETIEIW